MLEVIMTIKSISPLPAVSYEVASWEYNHKVYPKFHVCIGKNYYSVPYAYVGQYVDVKMTDTIIEVYNNHQRISTHPKFPQYMSNQYHTHNEDMPDAFNQPEMNDLRLKQWASSIGPKTNEVIERIFNGVTIKEQGYNSALSVLKLSRTYSSVRLETACEIALPNIRIPRYKHLKSILAGNQDIVYLQKKNGGIAAAEAKNRSGGYVRGPEYYGGDHYDK